MEWGKGGYGGKPSKVAERSGPSVRGAAEPEPEGSAALRLRRTPVMQRELQRFETVELVYFEPICSVDPAGDRIARAEKHAVESAAGACEPQPHVPAADDFLSRHVEAVEEVRLRETLTPNRTADTLGGSAALRASSSRSRRAT